jgi:transcription elongation GreA/GreB family factor
MKEKIRSLIETSLNFKIDDLSKAIVQAQKSANDETKSSAGDKYETGRAMAHNTIHMYQNQMTQFMADKHIFDSINFELKSDKIANGSLVTTNIGMLFLSISIGKQMVDGTAIQTLSLSSPLGKELYLKQKGDSVMLNGKKITILDLD